MKLAINQKYRIISDRQQWTIQEKRTRKGESEWMPIMYFGTFAKALGELGELMVRESNATTLVKALEDVEKVTTQLSQALTPQLKLQLEQEREGRNGN